MPPAKKAAAAAPKKGQKTRRREKKNIPHGAAHIKSTFNNTIVTITDPQGNVIAWASSGHVGFKGSRKSTPFAAQLAAENAARKAQEHGVQEGRRVREGPGFGPGDRDPVAAGRRPGGRRDLRRHPPAAQRLPSAQAPKGLGENNHGSLHRTHDPQIAAAAHRPRRWRPGLREASLPARPARPRADQGKRIPAAAAGEAEGPLHLRRDGEAVPPLLRRGRSAHRQDR